LLGSVNDVAKRGSARAKQVPHLGISVEHADVTAGVEPKLEWLSSQSRTPHGNENGFCEWEVGWQSIGIRQRDMFTVGFEGQFMGVIEAEKFAAIVNQQIETLEKIVADDTADVRVGGLQLRKVLNQDRESFDGLIPCNHDIENRHRAMSVCDRAAHTGLASGLKLQF
jgi:hypothetical protein